MKKIFLIFVLSSSISTPALSSSLWDADAKSKFLSFFLDNFEMWGEFNTKTYESYGLSSEHFGGFKEFIDARALQCERSCDSSGAVARCGGRSYCAVTESVSDLRALARWEGEEAERIFLKLDRKFAEHIDIDVSEVRRNRYLISFIKCRSGEKKGDRDCYVFNSWAVE